MKSPFYLTKETQIPQLYQMDPIYAVDLVLTSQSAEGLGIFFLHPFRVLWTLPAFIGESKKYYNSDFREEI